MVGIFLRRSRFDKGNYYKLYGSAPIGLFHYHLIIDSGCIPINYILLNVVRMLLVSILYNV